MFCIFVSSHYGVFMPSFAPSLVEVSDGTVGIQVRSDTILCLPAGGFAGASSFYGQDDIVARANKDRLHGYNDWRRATDADAETLSAVWAQVAPKVAEQHKKAAWFWAAMPSCFGYGGRAQNTDSTKGWESLYSGDVHPVLVVRTFSGMFPK